MMFCTIAVSILSGSIAEKNEIHSLSDFVSLWVLLIYSPVAHWVWGGGWISKIDNRLCGWNSSSYNIRCIWFGSWDNDSYR